MKISTVVKRIEDKGVGNASRYYARRFRELTINKEPEPSEEEICKILLLTNRDSDNVGDQVIEACDISLISTIMDNLNITKSYFKINSRAASLISQKYLAEKDEKLLKEAESLIKEADIIVFGGAPVFNYRYQNFYERTAVTLEIAEKYNKPVIFSAVGVDGYDEDNEKCLRLKNTLNFGCVKQITTRDNFESLQKFIDSDQINIRKVSDPAVFTFKVFENFITQINEKKNKKIGIFILRSNGFVDNGINFSRDDAAFFWKSLAHELKNSGYDYEMLTSGHFGDEAFLDYLIKNCNIDAERCVFNVNYPEKLIEKISTYDAVISCRLHPSIISYSLNVPSLGIIWNSKVNYFYDSIGYGDRVINAKEINPKEIVKKIDKVISEGVNKDKNYLISVYNTLFYGMKKLLRPKERIKPYSYDELMDKIVLFKGTSENEKDEKLKRKFRRAYGKYNEVFDKGVQRRKTINKLRAKYKGYVFVYSSGVKAKDLFWDYDEESGKIQKSEVGYIEYRLNERILNEGEMRLIKNSFTYPGYTFLGWRMRVRDNEQWYWYLEDRSFKLQMDYDEENDKGFYLFKDEELIPRFQKMSVITVVMEAVWINDGI